MKNYPRLAEMGIKNPQQIEKFAVYTTDSFDILRITYQRQKGSFLPVSRNYKFPLVKHTVMVNSGTRQTDTVYESTGEFREALHELEQIRTDRSEGADLAAQIKEEVRLLEEDIALRTEYLKTLVDKL